MSTTEAPKPHRLHALDLPRDRRNFTLMELQLMAYIELLENVARAAKPLAEAEAVEYTRIDGSRSVRLQPFRPMEHKALREAFSKLPVLPEVKP